MAKVSLKFIRRSTRIMCRFILKMVFFWIWFPWQWLMKSSQDRDNIDADSMMMGSSFVIPKKYGLRFISLNKNTYAHISNFGSNYASSYQNNEDVLCDIPHTHIRKITSYPNYEKSGVSHRVFLQDDTLHFMFHDSKTCKPYDFEQFNEFQNDDGSPSIFVYFVEEGNEESLCFCIDEYNQLDIWERTRFAILIIVKKTDDRETSNTFKQKRIRREFIGGYLSKYIDHQIIISNDSHMGSQENAFKLICQIVELVHSNIHNVYL
eukprot:169926_1